jgi:hypothetical protein
VEKGYVVDGPPEFYFAKPSLVRQRVGARHRTENITATPIKTKIITTRQGKGMLGWILSRWLPWFATPEGGRL